MENYKRSKKVLKVTSIKACGNSVYWPTIKINSACIGRIPINTPKGSIVPTVNRYFYIPVSAIDLKTGATIPSNRFYNDDGSPTTEFMIFSPNGYVNLYINGVMQGGGLYMVNANSIIINPTAGLIRAGTSIIIESLGFSS